MSATVWSHTRFYKKTVKALYDTHIHPLRCSWYRRHQEGIDDAWLTAEADRLVRVKLARDKAYVDVLFWSDTIRTASSKTYRAAARDELDRCTKQYLEAKKACENIDAEINRVHARRHRFGTRPRPTAAPARKLVPQPAT